MYARPKRKKRLTFNRISDFRGNELQNYFTKVLEDNLHAVVKPQYVDQIPKAIKGPLTAVGELVKSRSANNNYDDIMDVLELRHVNID
jgi:ATP-binding cassette subfamily E protein 1